MSYEPRIHHYLLSAACAVGAEVARHVEGWAGLGIALYVITFLSAFVITYAFVAEIRRMNHIEAAQGDEDDEREPYHDESVHIVGHVTPTQIKIFDLPATPKQIKLLAEDLLNGGSFSQRRWTGKGRPFSINQFNALRDEMLKRGMLYQVSDKDARQGYDLTVFGKRVMSDFLPSPTLKSLELSHEDM